MRLGDLDALKETINNVVDEEIGIDEKWAKGLKYSLKIIDNAPTVEIPENEVNCVLTMFGKCSYNETGCSDCEIKDKIRKALNERPQGEWKPLLLKTLNEEGDDIVAYESSCCGAVADKKYQHCPKCLAKMKGGAKGFQEGLKAAKNKTDAYWIKKQVDYRHYYYFCSKCGCCSKYKKSNYCPDCGRRMNNDRTKVE